MSFQRALQRLAKHEGGYVDHPRDPGGKTAWGITEATARAHGYAGHMRDMPKTVADRIYKAAYWDAIQADNLPDALRFDVFDAAVNSGVTQAIRWLQIAAGVTADGHLGPITLQAVRHADPHQLARRYAGLRLRFLADNKNWPDFGKGWARRVAANLIEA